VRSIWPIPVALVFSLLFLVVCCSHCLVEYCDHLKMLEKNLLLLGQCKKVDLRALGADVCFQKIPDTQVFSRYVRSSFFSV